MTDTAEAPADVEVTAGNIAEHVKPDSEQSSPDFSFVLDKYRAEGRTDQDAAFEQAKAYSELQKKFGAFTGAPDEYEFSIPEGAQDYISLDQLAEDPIYNDYKSIAKEIGLNNEGFNRLAELYIKGQMADLEAGEAVRAEEMKALGDNAQRRLDNISDWAKAQLDADDAQGLLDSLQSAAAVQAIEKVIAKTKNAPQLQDTPAAPSIDGSKLREMMLAKDQYGNRKMTSDPAYAKEVNRLYAQLYGEEPHAIVRG